MSEAYEEIFEGLAILRSAPGPRHELICSRLHAQVRASVANMTSTTLLSPRTEIEVAPHTVLKPDLALVTRATHKLWLAAEVVNSDDHRNDTVVKKDIYEQIKVPRLWMIDPRYDNIEIYHGTQFGLALQGILASREVLTDSLLPEFELTVAALFAVATPSGAAGGNNSC